MIRGTIVVKAALQACESVACERNFDAPIVFWRIILINGADFRKIKLCITHSIEYEKRAQQTHVAILLYPRGNILNIGNQNTDFTEKDIDSIILHLKARSTWKPRVRHITALATALLDSFTPKPLDIKTCTIEIAANCCRSCLHI